MGLTIYYKLTANLMQTDDIRELVGTLREFALDLPFEAVSELLEFEGQDAVTRPAARTRKIAGSRPSPVFLPCRGIRTSGLQPWTSSFVETAGGKSGDECPNAPSKPATFWSSSVSVSVPDRLRFDCQLRNSTTRKKSAKTTVSNIRFDIVETINVSTIHTSIRSTNHSKFGDSSAN